MPLRASPSAAGGPPAVIRSTPPITTRSGASRCTTSATSSSCCASRAPMPAWPGSRSFLSERAQAALAWITILRERERYRTAFLHFDPQRVADMSDADLEQRLADPAIVRNRLKVNAVRTHARAFLDVYDAH